MFLHGRVPTVDLFDRVSITPCPRSTVSVLHLVNARPNLFLHGRVPTVDLFDRVSVTPCPRWTCFIVSVLHHVHGSQCFCPTESTIQVGSKARVLFTVPAVSGKDEGMFKSLV